MLMSEEPKKVKVVLHCCNDNNPEAAFYRMTLSQLELKSGVQIDSVVFAGYLDEGKLESFLKECETAQIVITDAWNYRDRGQRVGQAEKEMASIVALAIDRNPKIRVFSQLSEGADRVAVHRQAEPHCMYRDDKIAMAIKLCVKKPRAREVLVFDDSWAHIEAAAEQLSTEHNLTVAMTYDRAEWLVKNELFDAVLLDLLVPASAKMLGGEGEKYVGQEMPLTPILAFLALNRGVKKVGILTDADHHNHPASAALDVFHQPFSVGDVKIVISNSSLGLDGRKDWRGLLAKLDE